MRALITGVKGFVGKYLADLLLSEGMEVWGTSRTTSAPLVLKNGSVTVVENELNNEDEIYSLLGSIKPDFIFHLAGQSNVKRSWDDKEGTFYANVNKTIFLLDACVRFQQEKPEMRLLTVGSSEEYGKVEPHELPIKETTLLRPISPYGASKAAVSMLIQQYHKAYGLNVIHARPFNHIGPGQSLGFVTSDFAKQVVQLETEIDEHQMYVGDLSSRRDFTDVKDIVRAYLLLCEKGISGQIYNVCFGETLSIQEVLNYFLSFATKKITVSVDKEKLRPVDIKEYSGSNKKIRETIGWEPSVQIKDSLYNIYLYWKETNCTN